MAAAIGAFDAGCLHRHDACGSRVGSFEPIDCGIHRESQPGFVEERAGDQAAGGEHPPEGVEQGVIGRRRRPPEIIELALKGQPVDVVNRLAEHHDRQSEGKRQGADRAVDRDHGRPARQERTQIAAVENDEPVGNPELDGEVTGNGGPVDQPAVERMELDDEPRRRRGVTGERGEDVLDRQMHRAERRVHPHLVIAIQLQRKKKQRTEGCCRPLRLPPPRAARRGASAPGAAANRHTRSADNRDGASRNAGTATFRPSRRSCRARPRPPCGESCPAPTAGRARPATHGRVRDTSLDLAAARNDR